MDTKPSDLILAILEEARQAGTAPVLKTALVKYLYLLDFYTAEHSRGKIATGWQWRFYHYGPYANAAVQAIDGLVAQGAVAADSREAVNGEHEFVLYRLADYRQARSLQRMGVPSAVAFRVQSDMKKFQSDLHGLLDYVYFETSPMAQAESGQALDFAGCAALDIGDVRPIEMEPLRPKAVKKTRERLRTLIQARTSAPRPVSGPYDETYMKALESLDLEPAPIGLQGKAKIRRG